MRMHRHFAVPVFFSVVFYAAGATAMRTDSYQFQSMVNTAPAAPCHPMAAYTAYATAATTVSPKAGAPPIMN